MSFKIDGATWEPQSTQEHAEAIMEKINALLQENNITDSEGNVVQLKQNFANALYLLALGDGQRFAVNDEKLTQAINSFNIELCDDEQIENLLPIAAVTRNPGSYSTLRLTVTASEFGDCTISEGTKAPYGNVNFVTKTEAIITAGTSQVIETVCDTLGPIAVLSGEVNAFETEIANLDSVRNDESSVPGVAPETTNELRKRIINGDTIKYSLDGCKGALEELTGVTYARVYFNYNTEETLELPGGVIVQPRTAYIVIHGSSDQIAEVYAEYMNAPTQNNPAGAGTYSVVNVTITAKTAGNAVIPQNTSVTYESHVFKTSAQVTIAAGTQQVVPFTCDTWGAFTVPVLGIQALDQTITNVESAQNLQAAIPGTEDPKHSQDWVTSSGQIIPIKYDTATEQNVFVKVFLKEEAESGVQVDNQIKRDLILASADWNIGEHVTQMLTCKPFVDCKYTEVAYTKVSLDGIDWQDHLVIGCNVIPRVSDGTISTEQLGE